MHGLHTVSSLFVTNSSFLTVSNPSTLGCSNLAVSKPMTTKRFLDLNILSQAPYGAYVVDMNRIITFWNRGAERILGHRAGEVIGLRCCRVLQRLPDNGTAPVCEEGCPAFYYARESRFPPVVHAMARCASGRRKPITITPVVIPHPHCDRIVLVNLFHERTEDARGETTAGPSPRTHGDENAADPAIRPVLPGSQFADCARTRGAVSDGTGLEDSRDRR